MAIFTRNGKDYHRWDPEERTQMMETIIEERIRTGSTLDQISEKHGLCRRTVTRWRKTEEWRAIENQWRKILREEARTEINETTQDAIGVLRELMHNPDTAAFTRMHSARAILEFSGIDQEIEEEKVNQNNELLEFLKRVETRPRISARVVDAQVLDGGLLPPEIAALSTEVYDAEYTEVES